MEPSVCLHVESATETTEGKDMTGVGWFAAIIIGGLAGWIAEKIMKRDHGLLMNIVLGVLGAILLNWILVTLVGNTLGGWIGQTIVGAGGACLLISAGQMIRR